jgi:hypothetical protein
MNISTIIGKINIPTWLVIASKPPLKAKIILGGAGGLLA